MSGKGLQRRMAFYVVFLATVFLTLAVNMTVFLRGERVGGALKGLPGLTRPPGEVAVDAVLGLVTLKVWVMLAILLAALALVFFLFIKRITGPLGRIIEAIDEIAAGNLSVSLKGGGRDEVGRLAQGINDLAANTQEFLLLSGGLAARARAGLARLGNAPSPAETRVATTEIEDALRELDTLLAEFGRTFFRGALRS